MSQRTSYRQGTPNWADLQTTDQQGAKSFYADLFGWQYDDQPMDADNIYSMAVHGGGVVAAIAPQSSEMRAAGAPAVWNTYLAVDDVDAAAQRVTKAGGRVFMEPFDVMEAGRMSFVADPTGAPVVLWQAHQHIGASVVNEPGAVIWNELVTDDIDRALSFYGDVLGVGSLSSQLGDQPYTGITVDGDMIAGTSKADATAPHFWRIYFSVPRSEDAVDRAVQLGATIVEKPIDSPIGVFAILRDPQGAEFGVFSAPRS